MKSHIIMSIAQAWVPGGTHTTTLTVSFGHPLHKTMSVPWSAIFVQPEVFGFENGTASFKLLKPLGADGTKQTNEELAEVNTKDSPKK